METVLCIQKSEGKREDEEERKGEAHGAQYEAEKQNKKGFNKKIGSRAIK